MCLNPLPLLRFCTVCGSRQRSLVLDTVTGSITGFCCLGKHKLAPPLVVQDPRDYEQLSLSAEDQALLAEMGIKPEAGFSLLELLAVVALLLILGAIFAPTLLDCLETVRQLMAMVNQVVVR